MSVETRLSNEGAEVPVEKKSDRRCYPRFPVNARVALTRVGHDKPIIARNKNISWGGASLLLSEAALEKDDDLVLRFPWREKEAFTVRAKVDWKQQVDDRQCLVGVSFSRLTVRDEEKLQDLVSMLMRSRFPNRQGIYIAEGLEMSFLDSGEMLEFLGQLRLCGTMETILFRSYEINKPFPFAIAGYGDLPTLHLRARVLWKEAIGSEDALQASGPFRVELAVDHPLEDIRRATDPLIERLNARDNAEQRAVA